MAYSFRGGNRDQGFLLPLDIREWIPESDLACTKLYVTFGKAYPFLTHLMDRPAP